MANKHMKRCSTPLLVRETQIKTTMRYHFTLIRMAIIKNPNKQKIVSVGKEVEKLYPSCVAGGNVKWYGPVENSIEVPQKLK